MKGNQNLPNKKATSTNLTGKPLLFHFALEAIVGKIETHLDTEAPINHLIQTQKLIMGTITLNHQVERVHHTQDQQIFRKHVIIKIKTRIQIILDHNHLNTIEMEIVYDNPSHLIAFVMYGTAIIHS